MKANDTVLGGLVLMAALFLLVTSFDYAPLPGQAYGAGTMPRLIGGGGLLLGLFLLIGGLRRRTGPASVEASPEDNAWMRDRRMIAVLAVLASVIFFMLASPLIGFIPTVLIIMIALMLLGGAHPINALGVSLITALVVYYGFSRLLLVPLPRGPIESLLW
ncbi:tripartite tricarboxylate transporter TctB family protein [Nitratireductor sp. CH_MIT9313-5]|uniref:tripartite tricarboxylate transporter TctB family protein n=1 Tax=Nitratireductor sp. CH_MIT9313-5 TaxID=3107764 RepID=UPI00300AA83D